MKKSYILLAGLVALMLLLAGCTRAPSGPATVTTPVATNPPVITTTRAALANPAATYCTQQAGTKYEIRTNPDGSQYGVCILPGGTECEEWTYYRGTCPPAGTPTPVPTTGGTGMANPSATYCVSKGYSYQIVTNQDGSQSGNCVFPSGKSCDGWAYYRGECTEATAK